MMRSLFKLMLVVRLYDGIIMTFLRCDHIVIVYDKVRT